MVDVVVVPDRSTENIVVIEESGPPGPPGPSGPMGPPGPRGLTGQGVLVLNWGEPVPSGTPDDTVIFRREV